MLGDKFSGSGSGYCCICKLLDQEIPIISPEKNEKEKTEQGHGLMEDLHRSDAADSRRSESKVSRIKDHGSDGRSKAFQTTQGRASSAPLVDMTKIERSWRKQDFLFISCHFCQRTSASTDA